MMRILLRRYSIGIVLTVVQFSIATTSFGGIGLPLPLSTTAAELQQSALGVMDKMTLYSLNYFAGSSSHHFAMERNQSVHAIEFKGYGDLPTAVLLHGISSCASDYYPLIRHLQMACKAVIAIDLPGHGSTVAAPNQPLKDLEHLMIECVSSVLCEMSPGPCILVGNSLGGFVATRYASCHPQDVHSLVLISPAGAPMSKEELERVKKLFAMETLSDVMTFMDTVFGLSKVPLVAMPALGWACRERGRRPSVKRILQEASINSLLSPEEVESLRCPVLLIWGEEERVFSEKHLKWFTDHLPTRNSEILRPKGVGHIPHLDSGIVTDLIVDFHRRMEKSPIPRKSGRITLSSALLRLTDRLSAWGDTDGCLFL